jgi:hypothetical protein
MKTHLGVWRGDAIGWGPLRADWFSFCSAHRRAQTDCKTCMSGRYRNRVVQSGEHFFYAHTYGLWHWWVNRPNSGSRKTLEEVFGNLKGG